MINAPHPHEKNRNSPRNNSTIWHANGTRSNYYNNNYLLLIIQKYPEFNFLQSIEIVDSQCGTPTKFATFTVIRQFMVFHFYRFAIFSAVINCIFHCYNRKGIKRYNMWGLTLVHSLY